jgi:hypothetical protein
MVLMENSEGKRLLGRPRRRCEINIRMDLQEVGWVGNGLDLVNLAKVRDRRWTLVNAVMKPRFP